MTENEKLRALLKEARGVISEDYDRSVPGLVDRIDAALAEPEIKWTVPNGRTTKNHTAIADGYYIVVGNTPIGITWQAFPQTAYYKEGKASSIEEAKEAAIKAIRDRS
jgi:hypothetical protein